MQAQVAAERVQYRWPVHVLDPVHAEIQHLAVTRRDHIIYRSQVLQLATLQVALVEDTAALRFNPFANHFAQKNV